jgi:hypothetical protein
MTNMNELRPFRDSSLNSCPGIFDADSSIIIIGRAILLTEDSGLSVRLPSDFEAVLIPRDLFESSKELGPISRFFSKIGL